MSVEEALAVLEKAAATPRTKSILSMLSDEMQAGGRDRPTTSRGKPPVFPTKETVAEEGDQTSAKGGHSSESGAKDAATARKG